MVTARKILLRPGVYHAPQGTLRATPDRVRRWAKTFREMQKRGIRIPIGWGHQPDAEPADADQRAHRQYYLSRYNAGYLGDMDVDEAGNLAAVLDVPGCELDDQGRLVAWTRGADGREVRTAICEVSAAIKDWKDGTGKLWPDSIIHVALTPLPVVSGQDGFRELGSLSSPEDKVIYLSLTQLSSEGTMAEESMETSAEGGGGTATSDHFAQAVEGLRKKGIVLPDDTTADNFWERLVVALTALEGEEGGNPDDPDGDGEEGVSYSGEDATPEQRPVMMSLTTATDGFQRKVLEREQSRHRKAQLAKVDQLEKRGMPPHLAQQYREQLTTYQLSMTSDGEVCPQKVDLELNLADQLLPKAKFRESVLNKTAERQARPQLEEPVSPEEIKKRAEAVSRK